ncbi:retrovirus-related pol polyprotein from transposon TNT 1-94 [Tanacetum coccineum]
MENEVANCCVDKKYFEIEKKELILDNDHLLEHIICQVVINVVMHADVHSHNVLPANYNSLKHDNIASELLKHENDRLMELLISQDLVHTAINSLASINDYKNCNSLEIKFQQSKESFQTNRPSHNQDAPEFKEFFIINDLQAQLKAKNISIEKLKEHIAILKGKIFHNRDAHVDYLKQTQENADILREIVEHARELRPLDSDLAFAFDVTPINRTRKVRSKQFSEAIGSKPMSNTKKDRVTQTSSSNKKKNKVEDHTRVAKSILNNMNRVSKPVCNANVNHYVLNANFELICATCHECMFYAIHDLCVRDYLNDVNARVKSKSMKSRSAKSKKKKMWKPTGKVYTNIGYSWKPTGWIFTIDGNTCPLTRIIFTTVGPPRKSISTTVVKQTKPSSNKYGKLKDITNIGSRSKSKTVGSKISYHSEHMQNWGSNISTAPSSSRTIRFGNDQIAKIMGYGDYQLGNVTISRVYYVEGLGHNLFSVGQFCDSDLEVASQKHTCEVWNLDGADLFSGSRDTNLYAISLDDMLKSSLISKQGLVRGLPKLKFKKDHLCSACSLGKSKKHTHKPKAEDTNQEKLNLFHVDLCGPMRVESINRKKYILVIVDDYSRFTSSLNSMLYPKPFPNTSSLQQNTYELMHDKKPDLTFLHVFGSLCYLTNDSEDLGKLKPKADIGIFVGYAPAKKAYRIYNKRTQKIMEIIHVMFDELTVMASEQFSSGPAPQFMTPGTLKDAPSVSTSSNQEQEQSPVISEGVEEQLPTAQFNDDPFHEILHEDSTSQE